MARLHKNMEIYDYIIVGAGSAGCVLANRLSAEPNVRVLLLEAGGRDKSPWIHMPLAMRPNSRRKSLNWGYRTEPEPQCYGRQIPFPRGKVIGGTSSINAMIYARGHPLDYDGWRQKGLTGWGYSDVLPFFKKSEGSWRGQNEFHGGEGPLKTSPPGIRSPLYKLLAETGEKLDYPIINDYNGGSYEGIAEPDFTITNGRRASSASSFLAPVIHRKNLTIETEARVLRVLIQRKAVTGVEYRQKGEVFAASSTREVILSGGTYNSPHLLMLSGIGPAELLRKHGVEVIVNNASVGENLQEHVNTFLNFSCNKPISFESQMRFDRIGGTIINWLGFKRGQGGGMPIQCIAFLRTQLESERPDIELLVSPIAPNTRMWFPGIRKSIGHQFSSRVAVLHPKSRGRVSLRSGDPMHPPEVLWNLFADPTDLRVLRDGFKAVRKIFSTEPLANFIESEVRPGPSVRSDDEIEEFLRRHCETAQHPAGTCRMGADDQSVVDDQLRVRDVEGLRVADCSIMPDVVGANTNAPTIMIAEMASDMIIFSNRNK